MTSSRLWQTAEGRTAAARDFSLFAYFQIPCFFQNRELPSNNMQYRGLPCEKMPQSAVLRKKSIPSCAKTRPF